MCARRVGKLSVDYQSNLKEILRGGLKCLVTFPN
jgi:hypothetical protein